MFSTVELIIFGIDRESLRISSDDNDLPGIYLNLLVSSDIITPYVNIPYIITNNCNFFQIQLKIVGRCHFSSKTFSIQVLSYSLSEYSLVSLSIPINFFIKFSSLS